ncbi:MAG: hypothetical protein AAF547_19085 [Actinomycetota bacterium]
MDRVLLRSSWDVDRVRWLIEQGHSVEVTVDYEAGPIAPEPKVEYLRMLLDHVQRRHPVENREYVKHPLVDARFLRRCVIRPSPTGGAAGVREPRTPRPDPTLDAVAAQPSAEQPPPVDPDCADPAH